MSLFRRDEIGAYLCSRRLCLVRMRRGLRSDRLLLEERQAISAETTGWQPVVEALRGQLAAPAWSGANVRAVIGDQWVRYAVVPWSDNLSSSAEQTAHARELLAVLFGDMLSEWTVSLSEAPPGEARLACATPNALLDALRTAVSDQGQKLISVQPQLLAAYNCWRHRLAADAAWFVTVEEGALAALRTGARGIERVHSMRIGANWGAELKRLQTFCRLSSPWSEDRRMYVDVPSVLRTSVPEISEQLHWLDDIGSPATTLHQLESLRRKAA